MAEERLELRALRRLRDHYAMLHKVRARFREELDALDAAIASLEEHGVPPGPPYLTRAERDDLNALVERSRPGPEPAEAGPKGRPKRGRDRFRAA